MINLLVSVLRLGSCKKPFRTTGEYKHRLTNSIFQKLATKAIKLPTADRLRKEVIISAYFPTRKE